MKKVLFAAILIASAARAEPDAKTVRTWKAKCASCHGAEGRGDTEQGKKMKIPSFADPAWQKAKTDAEIKTTIADGVKKEGKEMDPYKEKLAPEQIDALVGYIRTLK